MYLMSTRKSSNFRTIMGLEIIPTEKDVINFPNILFVYSRPLTRKRFSVVNIPHKRRADASKIGSNFLNEPIHLESNRFVICICSKSFYGIKDFRENLRRLAPFLCCCCCLLVSDCFTNVGSISPAWW